MYIDEVHKATIEPLRVCPRKLFFNAECKDTEDSATWLHEAYTFHREEIREFARFAPNTNTDGITLIGASGYLYDEQGGEYQAYVLYGMEIKSVYFLTIVSEEVNHTYDYHSKQWVEWKD
jgi:hypothetical protein